MGLFISFFSFWGRTHVWRAGFMFEIGGDWIAFSDLLSQKPTSDREVTRKACVCVVQGVRRIYTS